MGAFSGSLNRNIIQSAIYNMIISQEVISDNVEVNQTLYHKALQEAGLYGDQKLYYASDALKSSAWGNDAEASNLLALHRPAAPSVQAITINVFRQICLTTDSYLSKQAFATEGAFSSYTAVLLGWMGITKSVHLGALYNVFIGTAETSSNGQSQSVTLTGTNDGQTIAKAIADLIVQLEDYNRINDYGYLRSWKGSSLKFIWNSEFVNKIKKVDLPTIFHASGLVDKLDEDVMAPRYFGTIITNTNKDTYADNTPAAGKPLDKDGNYAYTPGTNHANGIVRSAVECEVTVGGTAYHLFPGDEIPSGTKLATSTAAGTLLFGQIYIEDSKVMCKIVVKLPPVLSAFSVGTSFVNAKSLTTNHYLTFGYNTFEYLKSYPFITIKKA